VLTPCEIYGIRNYLGLALGDDPPKPLVSVVLTTYNRRNVIARSIDSVLNQTYPNIELIIVDDASTDGTFEYVSGLYGGDDRVVYIVNDHYLGTSGARNVGIDAANGEWVAFQDCDAVWMPDKLEKQMELAVRAEPDVGMVYTEHRRHMPNGQIDICPRHDLPMFIKSSYPNFLLNHFCMAATMLVRKTCLDDVGGFDPYIHAFEDEEMSIRISEEHLVLMCDEPLVDYYEPQDGVGRRLDEKIRVECMILDYYRDGLETYDLKTTKVKAVWNEAVRYGKLPVFEKYFLHLPADDEYITAYLEMKRQ
jgi:glycosyltransferase involved in cell wall biosynthesis